MTLDKIIVDDILISNTTDNWGYFAAKRTGVKSKNSGDDLIYLQHDGTWADNCTHGWFDFKEDIMKILYPNKLPEKVNIPTVPVITVSDLGAVPTMNDIKKAYMTGCVLCNKQLPHDICVPDETFNIGVSDFAKGRHVKGNGKSYFKGDWNQLIRLVRQFWNTMRPGDGEIGFARKIIVTVPPDNFVGTTATLEDGMKLKSKVDRRMKGEDPFVSTVAVNVTPDPLVRVEIVLYSRAALLENGGKTSGDYSWEIVAILAKTVHNEPMHPLTMARNMLGMPGGTKSEYSAMQFAQSIYYWSTRVSVENA